jgi:hypothetical protein
MLYQAKKLGDLDKALATKLLVHVQSSKAFNKSEKALVVAALHHLI